MRDFDDIMRGLVPKGAREIARHLTAAGFECYVVGGCVRDAMGGIVPYDWDLATNATPDQMVEAVPFEHFDMGRAHGMITFVVSGRCFETTMFRSEGTYSDGRHPDSVKLAAHVEDDLARRDFTMNAMAWNTERGLVDPFGGAADLQARLLRSVGNPRERFAEDGLRIMRALRFAATRELVVSDELAEAMRTCTGTLEHVSAERVSTEIMRTLAAPNGTHLARTLGQFKPLLFAVLPELACEDGFDQHSRYHDRTLLQHTLDVVAGCPADPVVRLAALFHDAGKPETMVYDADGWGHFYGHAEAGAAIAEKAAWRLRLTAEQRDRLVRLVRDHDNHPSPTRRSVRRFIARCSDEQLARDLIDLMEADRYAHAAWCVEGAAKRFSQIRSLMEDEFAKGAMFSVRDLVIGGDDLLALGFEQGPALGEALKSLHAAVVDGDLPNEREALLAQARTLLTWE